MTSHVASLGEIMIKSEILRHKLNKNKARTIVQLVNKLHFNFLSVISNFFPSDILY